MDRRSINLALAGSLAAALSLLANAASAQDAAKGHRRHRHVNDYYLSNPLAGP